MKILGYLDVTLYDIPSPYSTVILFHVFLRFIENKDILSHDVVCDYHVKK